MCSTSHDTWPREKEKREVIHRRIDRRNGFLFLFFRLFVDHSIVWHFDDIELTSSKIFAFRFIFSLVRKVKRANENWNAIHFGVSVVIRKREKKIASQFRWFFNLTLFFLVCSSSPKNAFQSIRFATKWKSENRVASDSLWFYVIETFSIEFDGLKENQRWKTCSSIKQQQQQHFFVHSQIQRVFCVLIFVLE